MRLFNILSSFILEYFLIFKLQVASLFNPFPSFKKTSHSRGTVILIQGWNETGTFFSRIREVLIGYNFDVYTIPELGRNFMSLERATEIVLEFIQKNHLEDSVLIAHSKGGLIAYTLLSNPSLNRHIKKVITIATPYSGSLLGHLRFYSLHELRPSSIRLKELSSEVITKKIVNLYPALDNHVIPNRHLVLKGADSVMGHTRILEDSDTLNIITKVLVNS